MFRSVFVMSNVLAFAVDLRLVVFLFLSGFSARPFGWWISVSQHLICRQFSIFKRLLHCIFLTGLTLAFVFRSFRRHIPYLYISPAYSVLRPVATATKSLSETAAPLSFSYFPTNVRIFGTSSLRLSPFTVSPCLLKINLQTASYVDIPPQNPFCTVILAITFTPYAANHFICNKMSRNQLMIAFF